MTPVRVRFTSQARDDVREALAWYGQFGPAQTDAFALRLRAVVRLIAERPMLFARVDGEVRRALLRPFPHGLFYRIETAGVVRVLMVDADARDPAHRGSRFS